MVAHELKVNKNLKLFNGADHLNLREQRLFLASSSVILDKSNFWDFALGPKSCYIAWEI